MDRQVLERKNRVGRVVGLLMLASSTLSFGFDVGDKVIVIRDAEVRVDGRVVDRLSHGMEVKVSAVHSNTLYISGGHPGWIDSNAVVSLDDAIPTLSKLIAKSPMDAQFHNGRGLAWIARQNYEKAIADFDEAIRLSPHATWFGNRGVAKLAKGDGKTAVDDFNKAIEMLPPNSHASWYVGRGNAWKLQGEYDRAIADYNHAIHVNPRYVPSYNQLAWLWATCADTRHRNGPKAVQYATKACELGDWKIADSLDTLAAACGETGQFHDAQKWESKALELAHESEKPAMRERLEMYRHAKPYRESSTESVTPASNSTTPQSKPSNN